MIITEVSFQAQLNMRHIIVDEEMDHSLIGRPLFDVMGFVASQHMDSVREKFHLHDFSHIGKELLEMSEQSLGDLSNNLLKSADIPEFIEDLPTCCQWRKERT
jgi:hypothetical protein